MTTTIINGVVQGKGFAHFREEQPANTNGGTFSNGAWRVRVLNTTVSNTISGVSLASNQVTVPAGTYDISWSATVGNAVGTNKSRLYNTTTAAAILYGQESADPSGTLAMSSKGTGRLVLAGQSVLQVEHYCATTVATTGLGRASNLDGQNEVYTEIWIRQV